MIKELSTGKTIECRFEVSRDPKREQTKLVLVPEPLQKKLSVKKGAKVLIKPIISEVEEKDSEENEFVEESPPAEVPQKAPEIQPTESQTPITMKSHFLIDSPNCQLMVEEMSGLGGLRGADNVHFDKALALRWKELYGDTKIEEVTISDTVIGRSVRCKFKIEKDPKFEGKGLIQIPKSILKQLAVKEGSLVTVKPVVEKQ